MDTSTSSSPPDLSDLPFTNPPSSPLSVLTRSPTISPRASMPYRSSRLPSPPPSTACSGSASPMKSSDPAELEILVNPDGAPPPKRRRVERKPRITEYLDLSAAASEQSQKDDDLLEQLTHALRKKKKIVVIAGAGISVSAGSMYILSQLVQILLPRYKLTHSSPRLSILLRPLCHLTQGTWPERLRQASFRCFRLQARLDHLVLPHHGP